MSKIVDTTVVKKNSIIDKFCGKVALLVALRYMEVVKAEKQLQNKNHTEDWALDSHPCDHVTHSLYIRP